MSRRGLSVKNSLAKRVICHFVSKENACKCLLSVVQLELLKEFCDLAHKKMSNYRTDNEVRLVSSF